MAGCRGKGNVEVASGCRNDFAIYCGGSVDMIGDEGTQHRRRRNGGTGINGSSTGGGARVWHRRNVSRNTLHSCGVNEIGYVERLGRILVGTTWNHSCSGRSKWRFDEKGSVVQGLLWNSRSKSVGNMV